MTLTERILKGSSILFLFSLLTTPIGYLIRVLYSQTLSIELFGLFYATLAFFALITSYIDLGLGYSVTYLVPKFFKKGELHRIRSIFQYYQITQIIITLVVSLILYFSSDYLSAAYFKIDAASSLIKLFIFYLIANSLFSALDKLFIGLEKEVYYSSMQFLRFLFILGFSLLFWIFDSPNVLNYALAWTIANFVVVIIYYFLLLNKFSFIKGSFKHEGKLFKSMVSFGIPTLITTSVYTFITSSDTIFLTFFHGVREVGIYNIIFPLSTVSNIFLTPVNALLLPLTSNLMEGERKKIEELLKQLLKLVPFVSLYFGLFVALFPSSVASVLFGEKWVGLIEIPLTIFAIGFTLSPLSTILITILSGMGKVKERLKISVYIAIISILIGLVLIPLFSVTGVVISNILMYTITIALFSGAISKIVKIPFPIGYYIKLSFFAFALLISVRFLGINPAGWIQVFASAFFYTVTFALFGYVIGTVDKYTLKTVNDLLSKYLPLFNGRNRP